MKYSDAAKVETQPSGVNNSCSTIQMVDASNPNNPVQSAVTIQTSISSQTSYANKSSSFAIGNSEATLSKNVYGSDHSVAKEIEDGLGALLECAHAVRQQLQSQTSVDQAISESSSYVTQCANSMPRVTELMQGDIKCEKRNNTERHERMSGSRLSACDTNLRMPDLDIDKNLLCEKDKNIPCQAIHSEANQENNVNVPSQTTKDVSERNVFGATEVSTKNYIFSSLSLVDNQFVDNKALNELNQDCLSMLSEITEKYTVNHVSSAVNSSSDVNNKGREKDQEHQREHLHLTTTDKFYSLNTVPQVTHTLLSSQSNLISSKFNDEEAPFIGSQSFVKTAIEKVCFDDFSDFSEVSAVDVGLSCDTYLTIMQTLDNGEVSRSSEVPLAYPKTQASQSSPKQRENKNPIESISAKTFSIVSSLTNEHVTSKDSAFATGVQAKDQLGTESSILTQQAELTQNNVAKVSKELFNKGDGITSNINNTCNYFLKDKINSQDEAVVLKVTTDASMTNAAGHLLTLEQKLGRDKCEKPSQSFVKNLDCVDENRNVTKSQVSGGPKIDLVNLLSEEADSNSQISENKCCKSDSERDISGSEMTTSDSDATLCYGDSNGSESNVEVTPIKHTKENLKYSSESSVCTSETEAQVYLVRRSSNLPHDEDACDGINDLPTECDLPSAGGNSQSNLNKQVDMATEQSLSLGYHSYSPFEDSMETDILPLTSAVKSILQKPYQYDKMAKRSIARPQVSKLPKPYLHQPKPIRMKINLNKKQCILLSENESGKYSPVFNSNILNTNNNTDSLNLTPTSCNRNLPKSVGAWVATPPTGLKMKLTRMQNMPKPRVVSPLNRVQHTPKSCIYSPISDSNWSVQRSSGLKLKFSSSKLIQETVSHRLSGIKPSIPTHRSEHSPPSSSTGIPNKRRRKLTYEPGTLRW